MSKKRISKSTPVNGADSELVARFTSYLQKTLVRERFNYLDNLKMRTAVECSYEELEEKGQLPNQDYADDLENILMWEAIKNYLNRLSARECEIMICLYIHRMTSKETAAKLGLDESTVCYHKMKALKKIRKAMEDSD